MKERIRQNAVPALFFGMCVLGMLISGQNSRYVAQELISRLARNDRSDNPLCFLPAQSPHR
jgi:hypothetical protein